MAEHFVFALKASLCTFTSRNCVQTFICCFSWDVYWSRHVLYSSRSTGTVRWLHNLAILQDVLCDIDLLCTVHSIFIDASNIFDNFNFLMHGIFFTISLFRKAMGFPLEMLANWQVGKFINLKIFRLKSVELLNL